MPIPEHVGRLWRALDDRMGDVQSTLWGAVVTAPTFPAVWDANYARIDAAAPDLRLRDVADALLPALSAVDTDVFHVVAFDPEGTTELLAELSTLGHTLTWDAVMDLVDEPEIHPDASGVEDMELGAELFDRVHASMQHFGIDPTIAGQMRKLEEALSSAIGKRWFGVRNSAGTVVSLAALVVLEGVGYLDNVVTFPEARGQGYASAVTARAIAEARTSGAEHIWLLAEPADAPVLRLYARLGFREVGKLAATRGPIDALV
jgi:ribosomal protein S18 acetylase RimI-like enzyme